MKQSIQIQIPKPCHENWAAMTPAEKGRFCQACQKTVFDFTKASDRQIVDELLKSDSLCARLTPSQLNRNLVIPAEKKKNWFSYLAASAITMVLSIWQVQGQDKNVVTTEQTDTNNNHNILGDTIVLATPKTVLIKGTVINPVYNKPLPFTSIKLKNKNIEVTSDVEGNFSLEADSNDTIVFSYVGYKTKEIRVSEFNINRVILEIEPVDEDLIGFPLGKIKIVEPKVNETIEPIKP